MVYIRFRFSQLQLIQTKTIRNNMNGVISLEKEARDLLRQVLTEKDIVIQELTKQIYEYQLEIGRLAQKGEEKQRKAQAIEQHRLDDLMNDGFIRQEHSSYHVLIDITGLIRQKIGVFKIDRRVEIIKEANNDNCNAYKQLHDGYELLKEQSLSVMRQFQEKLQENQSIITSLKSQIKVNQDDFAHTIKELEEKVEILQDQNEMLDIESKQIQAERGYSRKDDGQHEEYLRLIRESQEKVKMISELNAKTDQSTAIITKLQNQIQELAAQNKKILKQKNEALKRYEQLELQYHILSIEQQANTGNSKVEQFQSQQKHEKKDEIYLQSKVKTIELQCADLVQENLKFSQGLLKLREENKILNEKNTMLSQLVQKASIAGDKDISNDKYAIKPELQPEAQDFYIELQSKLKELSPHNQLIIRTKQLEDPFGKIDFNKNLQISILSKMASKVPNELESHIFTSPAEKDTSFPLAQTPQPKILTSNEAQKLKSKLKSKRMIRIGY